MKNRRDLCRKVLFMSRCNMPSKFSGENTDDPNPVLHFCNYLPFEEGLALYLNNLEFPSPKNDYRALARNFL